MDLKRGICNWKFGAIIVSIAVLLFSSSWPQVYQSLQEGMSQLILENYGAVDFLNYAMEFDVFKVVVVLLFSGVYAGSFCRDENSKYIRMILCRADALTYSRSKFLSNLLIIIVTSLAACWLCIGIFMAFGFSFISLNAEGGLIGAVYYKEIVVKYPALYVVMIALQFGMAAAACSSAGMLLSAYQANTYITIGFSGFLFLFLLSFPYIRETPFDFLNLIGMLPVFPSGRETPYALMFLWGMLYPSVIIAACCLLFERRMKWRAEHGLV